MSNNKQFTFLNLLPPEARNDFVKLNENYTAKLSNEFKFCTPNEYSMLKIVHMIMTFHLATAKNKQIIFKNLKKINLGHLHHLILTSLRSWV